jgi:hypothetical protein
LPVRPDRDLGGHGLVGQRQLLRAGDPPQRRVEAGRVARGEQGLGVEAATRPPISFGTARSTSSVASDVRTCPLRPSPVDSADAV